MCSSIPRLSHLVQVHLCNCSKTQDIHTMMPGRSCELKLMIKRSGVRFPMSVTRCITISHSPLWFNMHSGLLYNKVKVRWLFTVQISPKAHRTLHQLPPGIGTPSFTVSSPWWECSAFSAAVAIHTVPICRSTWCPLLLGSQRRCGLHKAFTHD